MKTQIINMFPTAVILVENFLSSNQCLDIIEFVKTKQFLKHGAINNGSVTTYDKENFVTIIEEIICNVNSCVELKQNLFEQVLNYTKQTGLDAKYISNSWVSIQSKGSTLKKHTHPVSAISGALYLKADKESSKLYFYNTNNYLTFSNITEYTPYTFDHQWIIPKTGTLVLFPSWLPHGSHNEENQTEERTVLSFNVGI